MTANQFPCDTDSGTAGRELVQHVIRLMRTSSCFGREVCPTPPCACAQSLIDAITAARLPARTEEDVARAIYKAWMEDERWSKDHVRDPRPETLSGGSRPIAYFWAEIAARAVLALQPPATTQEQEIEEIARVIGEQIGVEVSYLPSGLVENLKIIGLPVAARAVLAFLEPKP